MWAAHLWPGTACGQVLFGICTGFHHRAAEILLDTMVWEQFSSATGYRPAQPRDSDLVVCAALAVSLTSVRSLLCLHRAGKSAGLQCSQGSASSHHPTAITGQCSYAAALHYGAKCPKSHLLLICHLGIACCVAPSRATSTHPPSPDTQWLCCHGEICLPADLPAPLAHTWLMETEPDCGKQEQGGSSSCSGMCCTTSCRASCVLACRALCRVTPCWHCHHHPPAHRLWWSSPETPIPRKSSSVTGKGTQLGSSL